MSVGRTQAIEAIQRFTSDVTLDHYLSNEILQPLLSENLKFLVRP